MPEGSLHELLEEDIENLSRKIGEVRSGKEGENLEKKEILKESIQSFATGQNALPSQHAPTEKEDKFLPDYIKKGEIDEDVKLEIERLLDLVFHKGLVAAFRESKSHSPFVQDAFHDALTDKVLPILEEKGLI